MLITVEGGEYTGKDLQIGMLAKRLFEDGYLVHAEFYEPGATLKSEIIRMLVKNKCDSGFVFPGDFRETFDLQKYSSEFIKEDVPPIAEKYLREAMKGSEGLGIGIKNETIHFLLNNSFKENGLLERTIQYANSAETKGTRDKLLAMPSDFLLKEYFSEEKLSPESQMYLYLAARNILHHAELKKALNEFDIVIMNRSRDSSTVYQGHAQNPVSVPIIRNLNLEATEGIIPDITLVLDISMEELARRKGGRSSTSRYKGITQDFFDEQKSKFHEAIREGYIQETTYYNSLPKTHPEYARLRLINGEGLPNEVHERIYMTVLESLNRK